MLLVVPAATTINAFVRNVVVRCTVPRKKLHVSESAMNNPPAATFATRWTVSQKE